MNSKVKQVYKAACGYIHFSDKGMLHSLSVLKSSKLGISVGKISDKDDVYIKEGYLALLHFTNILYERAFLQIKTRRKYCLDAVCLWWTIRDSNP